ncbi:extracellular solute-binding protein [Lachnospiraceae bacterium 54-53]
MKSKKLWTLALAGVMTASVLGGCSGSGAVDSGNLSDGSGGETGGKTTITFLCSGVKATSGEDFRAETLPRIVGEKFPDVTLEVTMLPDDQYYTALKTKLATGEAPDLLWVQPRYAGANATYSLAEAGYLEDLSQLEAVKKVGSASGDFAYKGKVYGMPGGIAYLGTYYNKTMFEENGLKVPESWDEFINCCETLKQAGIQPIMMGDKDAYVMQFGLYQLAANMIYPKDPEFDQKLRDGKAKFTDEGTWDAVLARYMELYEKGYIQSGSLGLGVSQAQQKFADGKCAMIFDGTFNRQAVSAGGEGGFETGFFPLPGNDAGEQLYAAGAPGAGPAIYSGSKNKDICKQILEMWYDGESDLYKAYETNGKFISTNEGAEIDPLFDPFMQLYKEGHSFYWCNQAWPAGTENEMEALFGEMIGETGMDVPGITKGMQSKFEELLKE